MYLYFNVDAWYIITVCGMSAGYTTNGNNIPSIHYKGSVHLPLLRSFPFLSCEKDAAVS